MFSKVYEFVSQLKRNVKSIHKCLCERDNETKNHNYNDLWERLGRTAVHGPNLHLRGQGRHCFADAEVSVNQRQTHVPLYLQQWRQVRKLGCDLKSCRMSRRCLFNGMYK